MEISGSKNLQQQIYAVFNSENDYMKPLFYDIDQASNFIFNNKTLVMPLKNKKNEVVLSI